MERDGTNRLMSARVQALWNMRWPAAILCGPMLGVLLVALWFGLPDRLWPLAGGFFLFSLVLFGILVRGEIQRVRSVTRMRGR